MAGRLNPAERTAAESDYHKKFNREQSQEAKKDAASVKQQEVAGDTNWKVATKNKQHKEEKRRFRLLGRRGGKLQRGSAFAFIFVLIGFGVWYTSVLAPNILLVNVKEMYTNDLADATTALEIYTQIMYFNKIGPMSGQDCIDGQPMDAQPIKCKLTTMSRSQKEAFERQGFMFGFGDIDLGAAKINADVAVKKVYEDNRDDGDLSNDLPESRYKVYAILPPNYKQIVDSLKTIGVPTLLKTVNKSMERYDCPDNKDENEETCKSLSRVNGASEAASDMISQLLNPLKSASQSTEDMLNSILGYAPITSGPQLWLYSQLSSATKTQVYSVFNPRSSFFTDQRFKERIKSRYNMTKAVTVTGDTEQKVNRSFDRSVQKADGGIDTLSGQPNPTDGLSLASLSGPLNLNQLREMGNSLQGGTNQDAINGTLNRLPFAADLQASANLLATNTYSYTDLMCSWYTIGKISSNALIRAKASTAARFALQYLKAADAIKAGVAEEVPTNILAGKLTQSPVGGYNGLSATDSLIYRSVTYGDTFPNSLGDFSSMISDPSKLATVASDGLAIAAYNLSAYENIGTLAASWAQVIPNAAALGAIIGASGSLLPPPANLNNADRQYCLSGETTVNKTGTKGESTQTTRCLEAVTAMAPLGMQVAIAEAAEIGRRTCPPVNASDDNLLQGFLGTWRGPVSNTMLPSQKLTQLTLTPYIAGWFGLNSMITAALTQQLYTSQTKGVAANYALFSGMGELLGDMAMSRGLMPSNFADMSAYLLMGEVIGSQKNQDDIARHNAKKNPFDPYNKFSFVGAMVRGLPLSTNERSPLLATLNNVFSALGNSTKELGQSSTANAFYHIQPSLLSTNGADTAERITGYLTRLMGTYCPLDTEYFAIGITPDIMCNVRYSMPLDDIATAINLTGVIDYMTGPHPDAYNAKTKELNERIGKADIEGNQPYLEAQLNSTTTVQNKPFIDKKTGKPTPGSEYEKYLQYCVNRLDPWGRSAIYMRYEGLSNEEKARRGAVKDQNGNAIDKNDPGDPNQKRAVGIPTMSVNATQSDLDWYTGKKCTRMTDQPEMLRYFRAYTTLCSVDGSMSNIIDCTEPDRGVGYTDPFYLTNDILFTSWY